MTVRAKVKIEPIDLLIENNTLEQSYHIVNHRSGIGRVDDEAIINIQGEIARSSDNTWKFKGKCTVILLSR